MSLSEELPLYKASYDLLLMIFQHVKNFKKPPRLMKTTEVRRNTGIYLCPKIYLKTT
jgi:hypothetical protein